MYPNSRSPIYDDPKYRCLCNVHVEKGASIFALGGAVLSGLALAGALIAGKRHYVWMQGVWLLLYLFILYAQKKHEPLLYLPYLTLKAISMMVWAFVCVLLFAVTITNSITIAVTKGPQGVPGDRMDTVLVNIDNDHVKNYVKTYPAVGAASLSIGLLIFTYLYSVVFRAWRYMRDEQKMCVPQVTYTV